MNKKMERDFEDLIRKHNGKWRAIDFGKLLVKWQEQKKIIISGRKEEICWMYYPKLFKRLVTLTVPSKSDFHPKGTNLFTKKVDEKAEKGKVSE